MKNLFNILFAVIFGLFTLTSCEKEDLVPKSNDSDCIIGQTWRLDSAKHEIGDTLVPHVLKFYTFYEDSILIEGGVPGEAIISYAILNVDTPLINCSIKKIAGIWKTDDGSRTDTTPLGVEYSISNGVLMFNCPSYHYTNPSIVDTKYKLYFSKV